STPDWLYLVLAGCGIACAAAQGGSAAFVLSCVAGFGCLVLATCAVSLLRSRTRARILTGGQIKLLAAGGTWLGVSGAAIMIVIAGLVIFLIAMFQRAGAVRRRPDASAIVAVAILSVALQQQLPGM
ncbi:MAG TPA: hypothetical protein VMQ93_02755, partial [Novosphingobium sp.]|nr:hypothetical protein [Novosphingobium sp.]